MREASFDLSESERVSLRIIVSDIDHELACLGRQASAAEHRSAVEALTVSWTRMTALLALGTAPELRQCPRCGSSGMRAATRCGSCWASLSPVLTEVPIQ
jgi:hypothetical protein